MHMHLKKNNVELNLTLGLQGSKASCSSDQNSRGILEENSDAICKCPTRKVESTNELQISFASFFLRYFQLFQSEFCKFGIIQAFCWLEKQSALLKVQIS